MLSTSPITNQPVGKTFSTAITVLGVAAVLQLVLIGWAFVNRARMGVPPVAVATVAPAQVSLAHITPAPAQAPASAASLDITANPMSEPAQTFTTASGMLNSPKPANRGIPSAEPANRFEELILQGKQLRERGDMSTAITKYREAAAIDPKSPVPLNELAITYEKMGLADKAAENWRRIHEMGPSTDIYYQIADAKLKASQANALRNVTETQPQPSTTGVPETVVDTSAPIEGIAAGAILGLLPVTAEDERDDNSAKRFILHIPIKARPKAHIEVRDLVIHVLFYDIVDGQNVVQTSANVSSRWATPPADWADSDTEELAVEYQLPKPEARAAKRENRKYFGYIVRIYYKQQLQAASAEPDRLAQQYPPPPNLPKENEK